VDLVLIPQIRGGINLKKTAPQNTPKTSKERLTKESIIEKTYSDKISPYPGGRG
jgi:hypothetical protein